MDLIEVYLGDDTGTLSVLQMSLRAFIIFFIALILVRLAGRRSFGMKAPFDNILVILLGAILGRAVVGASPLIPTIAASLVISILHRLSAKLSLNHPFIEKLIKGVKYQLYRDNTFINKNMRRSLVNEGDVMEDVRLKAQIDSLDQVEAIYMERNGEISTVKKL